MGRIYNDRNNNGLLNIGNSSDVFISVKRWSMKNIILKWVLAGLGTVTVYIIFSAWGWELNNWTLLWFIFFVHLEND